MLKLTKKNNILLVGGNGFVGKAISKKLNSSKIIFQKPRRSIFDLDNHKQAKKYIIKNRSNFIINCAGYVGGILENTNNNLIFFEKNLVLNYNLFKLANELKIKNIINLGSSCMYPHTYNIKMNEKLLMTQKLEQSNFGYALSKLSMAYYLDLIKKKNNFNYSTVIPCNLFGPDDNFDGKNSHLIAAVIRKVVMLKKKDTKNIYCWGKGTVKREFMYVDDLAELIIKMIKSKKKFPDFLNAGYGRDFRINEYYSKIIKILNVKAKLKFDKTKPEGMKRKLIDSNLAKKLYGWTPTTDINDGLKKTISFYCKKNKIKLN